MHELLTVYLCDDSRETIEKYSDLITRTAQKNQIDIALSVFENGESLIFHLSDTPDLPDIIYLDILMGKLNGIDTAKRLREFGCKAEIIFLTTSEDYVFDSF
ncbi:MAG: response regulator, partial [Lachnospiraceae bacterium]